MLLDQFYAALGHMPVGGEKLRAIQPFVNGEQEIGVGRDGRREGPSLNPEECLVPEIEHQIFFPAIQAKT